MSTAARAAAPPLPYVTIALVALNVLAYILELTLGGPSYSGAPGPLVAAAGNAPVFTLGGQPWRLATGMFLHGGLLHLGMNMMSLGIAGRRSEEEFGHARTLLVYLGGGLLASCASAVWSGHRVLALDAAGFAALHAGLSVGASGAVMAVFGALVAAALFALPTFDLPDPRPMVDWPLLGLIALTVASGWFSPLVYRAAHAAGPAAGPLLQAAYWIGLLVLAALGFAALRAWREGTEQSDERLLNLAMLAMVVLNVLVCLSVPTAVDQAAHVGGVVAGFVLGALLAVGRGRGTALVTGLRALACVGLVAGGIGVALSWGERNGMRQLREDGGVPIRILPPTPFHLAPDDGPRQPAEHV